MYSFFPLFLLLLSFSLRAEMPVDTLDKENVISDNELKNPSDCEDQFGNRGARFCESGPDSEAVFLGEVEDKKLKKDNFNQRKK